MSGFDKGFENDDNIVDVMELLVQSQRALNSSINYQFACVYLRSNSFSVGVFDNNYGNTCNTEQWISSSLDMIQRTKHIRVDSEYYNMPFRFEENDNGTVQAIVIKIPNPYYECECNYVGIVKNKNVIRYFTSELYLLDNEFHLCEFMIDGSHYSYTKSISNLDEFVSTILNL